MDADRDISGRADSVVALADRLLPHEDDHARSTALAMERTLDEYGAKKIPVPDELLQAWPIVCARMMQSKYSRVQARGLALIGRALEYNRRLAEMSTEKGKVQINVASAGPVVFNVPPPRAIGGV